MRVRNNAYGCYVVIFVVVSKWPVLILTFSSLCVTDYSQRTKIYVGNLSFYTTLDTVEDLFNQFGTVHDCYLPEDRETGGSRGFAFVTMENEGAQTAIDETDGYELDGRIIRVNEAQPRGQDRRDDFYDDDGDDEDYEEQESEY